MQLADCGEPLAYDTAFWLLGFEDESGFEIAELGRVSIELCGKLRALAIVALLTKGDSDKFLHNLIRSGRVRETYLARLRQHNYQTDHHLASGRVEGLLDAVAAGDLELARRIAWLSPRHWEPQREYEDDFCYAQILHRMLHGVQAAALYQPLVDQFDASLSGQPNARLDVVRALIARSQADFDEAFDSLLHARKAELDADLDRARLEEPQVVAERHVFVEGLAILRLAGSLGFVTQADYLYCPSLAHVPLRSPLPMP